MTSTKAVPAKKKESKHDKFFRLMSVRLGRALEEIRLVSQLSGKTYENNEAEAEEVIRHLDGAVKNVAEAFSVPYSTAIGDDVQIAQATNHLITTQRDDSPIDEIDVAKAIEFLNEGDVATAKGLLKGALNRSR